MVNIDRYFDKYNAEQLAQQLVIYEQDLGISAMELATGLARFALKSGDFEQAHRWLSVAIFEARQEQRQRREQNV